MRNPGGTGILLLLLLLANAGPLGAATGGGNVTNALPTVTALSHSGAATQPSGSVDVFTATVHDKNGENDIVRLKLATISGPAATLEHIVTDAERLAAVEPAGFSAGWKVWNPVADDGALTVRVQVTLANGGDQTWNLFAQDESDYQSGPAAAIPVTVTSAILVASDPVGRDGAAQTSARWGAWLADPGAANVAATNYLRVTNTGTDANQAFSVDFTETVFRGVTANTKTIPLDGNLQFAWWEDTSPSTTSPSEGTFTYGSASPDGSVAPNFTGIGSIIYVRYQIVRLPDPLLDQLYEASLTVTEL